MKSLLFTFSILLAITVSTPVFSQEYHLSVLNEDFQPLEMGIPLNGVEPWGGADDYWQIPIGFSFEFFGKPYNELTIWGEQIDFDFDNKESTEFIQPFYASLLDMAYNVPTPPGSLSPISYVTEGNVGERILKIEHRGASFFHGTSEDSVSFQTWLYESDNSIEIRIGQNNVDDSIYELDQGLNGPIIGLASFLADKGYFIEGTPESPVLSEFVLSDSNSVLNGFIGTPFETTVFRFTTTVSSTNSTEKNSNIVSVQIGESRLDFEIPLQSNDYVVMLSDVSGHKLKELTFDEKFWNKIEIEMPLNDGIYLVTIHGHNFIETKKIFIKR